MAYGTYYVPLLERARMLLADLSLSEMSVLGAAPDVEP